MGDSPKWVKSKKRRKKKEREKERERERLNNGDNNNFNPPGNRARKIVSKTNKKLGENPFQIPWGLNHQTLGALPASYRTYHPL